MKIVLQMKNRTKGTLRENEESTYLLLEASRSCFVQYPSHFPPHTNIHQHRYPDANVPPRIKGKIEREKIE